MVLKLRGVSVQLVPARLKTGSQFLLTRIKQHFESLGCTWSTSPLLWSAALRYGQNHGRVPLNLEGTAVYFLIHIKLAGFKSLIIYLMFASSFSGVAVRRGTKHALDSKGTAEAVQARLEEEHQ